MPSSIDNELAYLRLALGSSALPTDTLNDLRRKFYTNPPVIAGNGFPEGVVAAPVGTVYNDNQNTNGAYTWVKLSGTGNTGWVVMDGDTGTRDISSVLDTTGTILDNTKTNKLYVRRTADSVRVEMSVFPVIGSGSPLATLPSGFILKLLGPLATATSESGPYRPSIITSSTDGNVVGWGYLNGAVGSTVKLSFNASGPSLSTSWPSVLPGIAV